MARRRRPRPPRYDGPFWLQASATLRFSGWDTGGRSASGEAHYQADSEAPLASATPDGGLFATDQLVELRCSDGAGAGCALIRYTLDGSAVGPGSPVYGLPMVVASDTRLRFVAVDRVGNQSVEGDQQYRFDRTGPNSAALPAGGAFRQPVDVTLGCADVGPAGCATIHYTVDGSAPTPYSPVAEAPLTVAATTTVRLLSVDTLGNVGPDVTERYVVDGTPPVSTASPAPGLYSDGLVVRFACEDLGVGCAITRYTLDGSEPASGSPEAVPGSELRLSTSTTVRFASEDLLGNLEPTRSARFEIDARAPVTTASPAGGTFAGPVDLVLACDDGTGADASGCGAVAPPPRALPRAQDQRDVAAADRSGPGDHEESQDPDAATAWHRT